MLELGGSALYRFCMAGTSCEASDASAKRTSLPTETVETAGDEAGMCAATQAAAAAGEDARLAMSPLAAPRRREIPVPAKAETTAGSVP